MAKAFGGRAEQQGDGAGRPDVCRQAIVGQAAVEEWPPIVLVEQILGLRLGMEGR